MVNIIIELFYNFINIIYNIYQITDYIAVPTMTSKTTTITGNTISILNGTYRCSSSGIAYSDNYFEYFVFDSNNSTFWNSKFKYDSSGNFNNIGAPSITTIKDNSTIISVIGEWIQIQLPYSLSLSGYRILPRSGYADQYPKKWYMVGSNDGSNWYVIDYNENISVASNSSIYYNYGSSYGNKNYYSYFRIIIINIQATGSNSGTTISEINLSGTGKPLEYYTNTYELPSYNAVPAMTSASTTITGNMPAILNGTYISSMSSIYAVDLEAYRAFDSNASTFAHTLVYYGNSGVYTGPNTTSVINTGSISGEWIQIKLPYSLSLSGYRILPRSGSPGQFQNSWYMVGSNNGTTWYAIDNRTSISVYDTGIIYYYYGSSYGNKDYYSYFRMIITQGGGWAVPATIAEINLSGTGKAL